MKWEKLLAWVSGKIDRELRLKIEYLGAENRILCDQIQKRPRLSDAQRIALATIGAKLGKSALEQIASIVTPDTILRWHRQLVARKFDTSQIRKKPNGRPQADAANVKQVLAAARENPAWGYRRIAGAMAQLGVKLSHQAVKNILQDHGIGPSPKRRGKTDWADFIKSHTDCLLATDFFTTEVWTAFGLVTYYCLFFIHIATRKVYLGGITANPTDGWMRQAVAGAPKPARAGRSKPANVVTHYTSSVRFHATFP